MIFLQQLECGYEFPASAGVLEWFISTSGEAKMQKKSLVCIMKIGLDAMPLFLLDDLLSKAKALCVEEFCWGFVLFSFFKTQHFSP